ncbi:PTS cellobiose transporter subunit IIC, partial [Cronobacter sakazakii]
PRPALRVIVLGVASAIISPPFYKVNEKQLRAQEGEEALKGAQGAGEQAA